MRLLTLSILVVLEATFCHSAAAARCRNVPGDPGFPTSADWVALNSSVSGRLVAVVPSAQFCRNLPSGACTDAQWTSSVFRNTIPGALNQVRADVDCKSCRAL